MFFSDYEHAYGVSQRLSIPVHLNSEDGLKVVFPCGAVRILQSGPDGKMDNLNWAIKCPIHGYGWDIRHRLEDPLAYWRKVAEDAKKSGQ